MRGGGEVLTTRASDSDTSATFSDHFVDVEVETG